MPRKMRDIVQRSNSDNWDVYEISLCKDGFTPRATKSNVEYLLRSDPELNGIYRKDAALDAVVVISRPPYEMGSGEYIARQFNEFDFVNIPSYMARKYRIDVSPELAYEKIKSIASCYTFDKIVDYVKSIRDTWDGNEDFVNCFFPKYFGSDDNEYTRLAGKRMLVGGIARAIDPGCSMHLMAIICGKQGIGKSSGIRALSPSRELFIDNIPQITNNPVEPARAIQGKWIVEIGELTALRKSENDAIKNFITTDCDEVRPMRMDKYVQLKRRCILWGTTNKDTFLSDETGNRRFLPIMATDVNFHAIREDRDKIWSQALSMWEDDVPYHLSASENQMVSVEHDKYFNFDDWTDIVNSYVSGKTRVHKDEIYDNCLFILGKDRHNGTSARLKAVMMKLGWHERQSWTKADRGRRFFYKDEG